MQTVLLVGLGGFFGALSRYGLSLAINLLPTTSSSWGYFFPGTALSVLLVNLMGSFAAGWWMESLRSANVQLFLITGFLGSFTTFSSFSKESFLLLETKNVWWFAGFIILNVFGALLSFVLGYYLNR